VADQLTPQAREIMDAVVADLRQRAVAPERPVTRFGLDSLDEAGRAAIADILGEGDVWAKVGVGERYWRVVESVLPGVWRLEASAADGSVEECIDVGPVPGPILQASAELPRATIDIPRQMPHGAMNAPYLLAELQDRSSKYQPGVENHIINFTLLPLTDVDSEVLTGVLGQIPLVIRSGGYGSSRVFGTGLRHVWAVQYVNGMGHVILDTLEVGGVPVAVLAAREDFEDSAERLAEILLAFTS
jgi:hydrogenase-1 operon protein HyaF